MVMLEEENDNDVELYVQLRNKFLQEIGDTYDEYDLDDVYRIRTDDDYCKRFIRHKKGNFDEAYAMLKEALAWRKSFGVKDCTEDAIPNEFFEIGGVFPFKYDKGDNPNIMILVRHHRKNPEFAKDIRKFVIYWVEKMESDNEGKQMTVVMSCTGAGLSNLDLDLIKFLITLFRSYYPDSLAHILIFEMPWIFNAAWKIIKSWLPEDFVEKIVFVNKTTILNFIEKDNLPIEMGGTCSEEEVELCMPRKRTDDNSQDNSIVNTTFTVNSTSTANSRSTPRVHFADENGDLSSNIVGPHRTSSHRESSSYKMQYDDHVIVARMLKISPPQELAFQPPGVKQESEEIFIKLQNISDKAITYKIKTNNIDNYRVKPSIGVIEAGGFADISVHLVKGKRPQILDKFLVMAMQLPDGSISTPSLNHLWRTTRPTAIVDHKLRCVLIQGELTPHEQKVDQSLKYIIDTLGELQTQLGHLEKKQVTQDRYQKFTLCLLLFFGVLLWSHVICEYFSGFGMFYSKSAE